MAFRILRLPGSAAAYLMVLLGLSVTVAFGQQKSLQRRQFPPGAVRRIEDMPTSRLRAQIERLPVQARDRAVASLGNFHFTELDLNSLQVDPEGGIYYADTF